MLRMNWTTCSKSAAARPAKPGMPLGVPARMMLRRSASDIARRRPLSASETARAPTPPCPWQTAHLVWNTFAPASVDGAATCGAKGASGTATGEARNSIVPAPSTATSPTGAAAAAHVRVRRFTSVPSFVVPSAPRRGATFTRVAQHIANRRSHVAGRVSAGYRSSPKA